MHIEIKAGKSLMFCRSDSNDFVFLPVKETFYKLIQTYMYLNQIRSDSMYMLMLISNKNDCLSRACIIEHATENV